MLSIFPYCCKWTEIVGFITQKLGRKVNTKEGVYCRNLDSLFRFLIIVCLFSSWAEKPQASSVEEIMVTYGTNFDQFRKCRASRVGDSGYPTSLMVSPNNRGPAKPPSCTFGVTAGQEQVLLFLISIPKEFRQHIRYFSSIEPTFLYLSCKPGGTLPLRKQSGCWYCLCASLFGQCTQL